MQKYRVFNKNQQLKWYVVVIQENQSIDIFPVKSLQNLVMAKPAFENILVAVNVSEIANSDFTSQFECGYHKEFPFRH